ncbi:uncharacterized protein LOC108641416 [Manacus vitellinus]|uniref:uncharacterized protein LOC108641416 n=1 Tax=Manacus vitellinus TaxID=328815 RepID=UPI00084691E9|nr:uncharacterized protein LOC108641416 [Manacus vitellinus]
MDGPWWDEPCPAPAAVSGQLLPPLGTSSWIKADACRGNSTGSWECELYFDRIHDIYWARVRAVAGGEQSEWASSSELQLYRDTIVGPPKLSWLLQDQILHVNIATPLTPYQRRTGSYKPVDRVLLKLWYWLHLYEGDLLVQQVCGSWAGLGACGACMRFPGAAKLLSWVASVWGCLYPSPAHTWLLPQSGARTPARQETPFLPQSAWVRRTCDGFCSDER